MTVLKNDIEIALNDETIKIQIDENDCIKINEYVRFFETKLELGSLILIDENRQIKIENITNVINISDATVVFNDFIVDSMDQLFELVKHSLDSSFSIDFNDLINDNDDEFTLNLFENAEEINDEQKTDKIEVELEKDNTNLLIVIYTNSIDSILNFPLNYAKESILNNSWDTVNILFWNNAVNCILESEELKIKIEELKKYQIKFNYKLNQQDVQINSYLKGLDITHLIGEELLSSALKSNKWTVLSV
ncbi:hypothetical protein [Arcobacter arenosus]|uniref:Uncharacterized protein n=1 Tax=Arcobacter arenosus TaxID=2576037 RepID=A0A5R8XZ06_9BACT|nr:hypothetical protein [Arcobacter arenosus]TLP37114.1 hypothetical protein FDK22_12815 [Arcobacter arenosus]